MQKRGGKMTIRQHRVSAVAIPTVLFIIFGLLVSGGAAFSESTSMADVKKELSEAMDAIRAFSAERKEDALKAMEQALIKMDRQIDLLGDKIKKEWEQMEPEARKKAEETMKKLHQQRDRMANAIEEWSTDSATSWNKIKEEFMKSYEEFKKSYEDADEQYDEPFTYL